MCRCSTTVFAVTAIVRAAAKAISIERQSTIEYKRTAKCAAHVNLPAMDLGSSTRLLTPYIGKLQAGLLLKLVLLPLL